MLMRKHEEEKNVKLYPSYDSKITKLCLLPETRREHKEDSGQAMDIHIRFSISVSGRHCGILYALDLALHSSNSNTKIRGGKSTI